MGEPVNLINITDIDPIQIQKNAREMIKAINLTLFACGNLLSGSILIYPAIIRELFRNNLEAYTWASIGISIIIAANLLIMMFQVTMVIRHYTPTLGLKKDSPFDFGENVVAGKEYDEATISRDKRVYKVFFAIIVLIIIINIGILFHNIESGSFFHLLSLYQLYGGICFILFYVVHSYLAFSGKTYIMDWHWGRKSERDAR